MQKKDMDLQSLSSIERYALLLFAFMPRWHEAKSLLRIIKWHCKGGDAKSVGKLCEKLHGGGWLKRRTSRNTSYCLGRRLSQQELEMLADEANAGKWWPLHSETGTNFDYYLLEVLRVMWCGDKKPLYTRTEAHLQSTDGCEVLRAAAYATAVIVKGEIEFSSDLWKSPVAAVLPFWMNMAFVHGLPLAKTMDLIEARARSVRELGARLADAYVFIALWRGETARIDIPSVAASSGFVTFANHVARGEFREADKVAVAVEKDVGYARCKFANPFFDNIPRRVFCAMVSIASRPEKIPKTRPSRLLRGAAIFYDVYRHDAIADYKSFADELSANMGGGWQSILDGGGTFIANAREGEERHPLDDLLLAWDYRMLMRSRTFCRELVVKLADEARLIASNGYLTLSRLIYALLNGGFDREAYQPVLQEVESKGVLLIEPVEPQPEWRHFLAELKKAFGEGAKSGPRAGSKSSRKKFFWLVGLVEVGNASGWMVDEVLPMIQTEDETGAVKSREVHEFYSFNFRKYRPLMSEGDLLVEKTIESSLDGYGSGELLREFVGMTNLLLKTGRRRYGDEDWMDRKDQGVKTIPLEIRERRLPVETTTMEDGGCALSVPEWLTVPLSCDWMLRKVSKGVFEYLAFSSEERRLVSAINTFGSGWRVVLPRAAMKEAEPILASMGDTLDVSEHRIEEGASLPRVEGRPDVVVRLAFDGAVLAVRAVVLPLPDNVSMTLDPGAGQVEKLITGATGDYVLVRDLNAERKSFAHVQEALSESGDWFDGRASWTFDDLAAGLSALASLKSATPPIRLEWLEERRLSVSRAPKSAIALGARRTADDWFRVDGEFHLDDGRVLSLMEVVSSMANRAGNFVRLSDGDYLALTKEMVRQLDALKSAGRRDGSGLDVSKAAVPMLDGVFGAGEDSLELPEVMAKTADEIRAAFKRRPAPPKTLNAELRPYQTEGFMWLSRLASCGFGSCLADDMGLGKTVQVIALLLARASDGPSLVVAPSSVCGNWRHELLRFAPTLQPVMAWELREGLVQDAEALKRNAVVVASYGYLLFHESEFASIKWNGVVLDEAQAIKNDASKRARAVKRLHAGFRVAATGTPVENRLGELWSLFDFLNPGLLGPATSFAQRLTQNGMASPELKRMVRPLILRRLKGDVLDDLPEKTEVTVPVELGTAERTAYEACRRHALSVLEDSGEDGANRMSILAELTRLRRFCCHPSLVLGSNDVPSAKLEALVGILEGLHLSGHRALVFSQFTDYLAIVRKTITAHGWTHCYLDGSTPTPERARLVDAFQSGEGDFFLISLKAGGTGLNLTAADYVILLDPWWNPAVENQAADRAHRIGQRRPVTVYRLIASDTVEERVLELHREKQTLAEDVLDGTASSALSPAELMRLFR